jgi:hypothetical protein
MAIDVEFELAALRQMTVAALRERYAEVFGEPTRSRHKEHLVRRIIWRMQANAEGDLSERARRRAMEIANDADLRVTPPPALAIPPIDGGASSRGDADAIDLNTQLVRNYRGRKIVVTVNENGFEYKGDQYRSLSAVAKAVTGTHWNGRLFFGVSKSGGAA